MQFTYTGTNANGETITDVIEANNLSAAKQILNAQQITVLTINLSELEDRSIDLLNFFNQPTIKDLIMFSKQMNAMLKAGLPIIKSINIVSDSCKNPILARTMYYIAHRLEAGYGFADSINKHHKIFPQIMCSLISIGETTGTLEQSFKEISMHLEKEHDTKKRIAEAMRYPIFVVSAIAIALIIINVLVIPSFAGFFRQFHAKLPLATRMLIATSKFFVHYWWLLLVVMVLVSALWLNYINTKQGRFLWDRFKLYIPVVGSIIERSLLSRFARSFAICFRAGIPLLEAINLIAITADNAYIEENILAMRNHIEHGESMTIAAKNTHLFNSLVLQMILIGEETGELDKLLDEVSYFYEQELDYDIKQLSSLIEPILISIMAILVLILALGIFVPMWDMARVVNNRY